MYTYNNKKENYTKIIQLFFNINFCYKSFVRVFNIKFKKMFMLMFVGKYIT